MPPRKRFTARVWAFSVARGVRQFDRECEAGRWTTFSHPAGFQLHSAPRVRSYGVCVTYRAEAVEHHTETSSYYLGEWGSVTDARSACNRCSGTQLHWTQPWDGLWEARNAGRQYRVSAIQN